MQQILCEWTDDGTFKPLGRHAKACDSAFVVGQRYLVEAELPRNMASHRHYFAQIKDAWSNLREDVAEQFPSPEALRKFALIRTGYCNETMRVFQTHKDAVMAAAFVAGLDDFAVVEVSDNVLRCWRAKSQSVNDMGADEFRASKEAVLTFVAGMIGVPLAALVDASERSAA